MATQPPQPKNSESDIYDRQIRLWGAEAQSKIGKTKVLYVHISGVSAEILKNLVLAGVRADICDGRPVEAIADTPTSFLLPKNRGQGAKAQGGGEAEESASKKMRGESVAQAIRPHIEELNPLLGTCVVEEKLVEDLTDDYFAEYNIVIASCLGMAQATRIASAVSRKGGHFYLVDCFGWWGAATIDLGSEHMYRKEQGKDKLSDMKNMETYLPLKEIFEVKLPEATDRFNKTPPPVWLRYRAILEYYSRTNSWPNKNRAEDFAEKVKAWLSEEAPALLEQDCMEVDELHKLASMATAQVSPVCAVLGGVVGNEIIKVISGKGEPANNTLLFDGVTGGCQTFLVGSKYKGNNLKQ